MKSSARTVGALAVSRKGSFACQKLVHFFRSPPSLLIVGALLGVCWGVAYSATLRDEVAKQEVEIEDLRQVVLVQVDDLSERVEVLNAKARRIDALGQQLTQVGGLDGIETQSVAINGFSEAVGVGGPEVDTFDSARKLFEGLEGVGLEMNASADRLSEVEDIFLKWQDHLSFIPSGKPTQSRLTSSYGYRSDPFHRGKRFHSGVDFKARTGDRVNAVASGVVVYSGNRSGYGYTVDIDHGNGYLTRYAHNSRLVRKVGDEVRAGEEIAKAGSTGRSTGPHVHFEVWKNGKPVDPGRFIHRPSHYQVSTRESRRSDRPRNHQG